MGEQQVAGWLDRRYFDPVFDRNIQNIAVPIEIISPYVRGKRVEALPCAATEFCLVPGTGSEARDAKSDTARLLGSPQRRHACYSAWGLTLDRRPSRTPVH